MGAGTELVEAMGVALQQERLGGSDGDVRQRWRRRRPYGRREGRETVGAFIAGWDKAFSDINLETFLLVGDEEAVMVVRTFRAMNTGPFGPGVAATGRTLVVEVITVGRIGHGRFTSMREYYDPAM